MNTTTAGYTPPRRRIKVSHKLRCSLGKAFTIPHDESMESLLSRLQKDIFSELPPILRLRTEDLAEVIDIAFIRDGDQLGTLMTTTRSSLTKTSPESVLARMFAEQNNSLAPSLRDKNNAYLLDRTPRYFEALLHYLRSGSLVLDPGVNPLGVYEEAKYFGVKEIISELESRVEESLCRDTAPLSRREVIDAIISTSNIEKLRFQGVNISGADLSKLDLSNINFKHANLSNCQMTGTNLSRCNLERANLSNATMDNAQLVAVKMACADLEGASIRGGKFEDPEGTAANMEGANLKNTDFENSNMAGINLRVATLKNANLKNCDLRGATLAGANLELCDLSGSDLHNANLRGANLKRRFS
ncbi:KCTD9 [Lepeophtheirus salmonis]|uniref:KCTD9 n=1 Tax=Lepeophtheirus salmonis TaxID=72036 RepID=A0A7R8CIC5_LEPSM|nr:KCTD9 [Lepeophtheirus salmonis]CAF2798797.1 KCTD9 [Lepeophtheirus salmonis]